MAIKISLHRTCVRKLLQCCDAYTHALGEEGMIWNSIFMVIFGFYHRFCAADDDRLKWDLLSLIVAASLSAWPYFTYFAASNSYAHCVQCVCQADGWIFKLCRWERKEQRMRAKKNLRTKFCWIIKIGFFLCRLGKRTTDIAQKKSHTRAINFNQHHIIFREIWHTEKKHGS